MADVLSYFGPEVVMMMPENCKEMVVSVEQVTLAMQRYYPQDHPFWLLFREQFRLTGSISFFLMLGAGPIAAKIFKLPKQMIDQGQYEEKWIDQRMRLQHGRVPRTPMDPGGLCNCECGKTHEAAVLGAFLMRYQGDPHLKFEEVGAIHITAEMVNRRGLYNIFDDNRPFRTLPVIMDSADGKITMTCIRSKKRCVRSYEAKSRTEFMPWWTPVFDGADFQHMNDPAKPEKKQQPFEKMKNYYATQACVFHPLALETDEMLFVSHATETGVRVFLFEFNVRYASIVISFLNLIYERFASRGLDVPTDWAYHQDDPHIRAVYDEFVRLTNEMCDNTPPYDVISGEVTLAVAREMKDPDHDTESVFLYYPNVPKWPAPMTLLCYHARALFPESNLYWVGKYHALDARRANIDGICGYSTLLKFAGAVAHALMENHEYQERGADIMDLFVTQHELVQRAEAFVVSALALICRCRDASLHTPGELDVETMCMDSVHEMAEELICKKIPSMLATPRFQDMHTAPSRLAALNAIDSEDACWQATRDTLKDMLAFAPDLPPHTRCIFDTLSAALDHTSLTEDLLRLDEATGEFTDAENQEQVPAARMIACSVVFQCAFGKSAQK